MAKKSSIVKNDKRKVLAEKFEPIRKQLRKQQSDMKLSPEERFLASFYKASKASKIWIPLPSGEQMPHHRSFSWEF